MKKMILSMSLLVSVSLYAADKVECEELFWSATYNFYLENACKYDKNISVPISKMFEKKGCSTVFNENDIKRVTNAVLGSTYKEMNETGREKFCKEKKITYDELKKIYL